MQKTVDGNYGFYHFKYYKNLILVGIKKICTKSHDLEPHDAKQGQSLIFLPNCCGIFSFDSFSCIPFSD